MSHITERECYLCEKPFPEERMRIAPIRYGFYHWVCETCYKIREEKYKCRRCGKWQFNYINKDGLCVLCSGDWDM